MHAGELRVGEDETQQSIERLKLLSEARASLVEAGKMSLQDSVDLSYEYAMSRGLVALLGDDEIQTILAQTFGRKENKNG
jgi:hypothetical protein